MSASSRSQSSVSPSSFLQSGWATGYRTLEAEHAYGITDIEGTIPPELTGTLFRNGPGRFDRGGVAYGHPFDGDGMIAAVSFKAGRAHFQNRYVRTEGFIKESQAGRILLKNVFGTLRPGGFWLNAFDFSFKNVANTNVIYWNGRLFALWEAAPPHRLDPASLETFGTDDLGGVLAGGKPFTAHPRLEPQTGDLLAFGVRAGLVSDLALYRLTPSGQVQVEATYTLPGFAFLHDFAFSDNYWIFFQSPLALDPLPFVFGMKAAGECLRLAADQPGRMLLIPRSGGQVRTIETEPFFAFHHVNAFEQEGTIVLDSVRYEEYLTTLGNGDFRQIDFDRVPQGWLWRSEIDVATGEVRTRPLLRRAVEFPQIHPDRMGRSYRFVYLGATASADRNGPLQAIGKFDIQAGEAIFANFAPEGFISEPVFVPRPESNSEDDGWVIAIVYDAQRQASDIVILDARSLDRIARLLLPHHVPYGLHGSFVPEVFVDF
ncbi:carotenoid oxygenase family protein [Gloeobacter kilaueensis]|uniref:Carotenoid oxygenase n=1 Tax=Gloeobacter kilaueensis (strain ATCC BAA-2537 / CCAP 1431/1 / ULC 316 / JS1) TaxID=1183438 RepID=U5QDQ8_GLOK1|nr:carotenoid oxygenase family protein [Gloeobacter kilaueensis]AGY57082.1 carotenoid oxygenase [Gloeobacter kilaueensis JS1]